MTRAFAALALALAASPALAGSALDVLGARALDLEGRRAGTVEDLIVDTDAGKVLYVIVDTGKRFRTLPIRALRAASPPRMDMALAGAMAEVAPDPRLRRAARLLGQPVERPDGGMIGGILDFEFALPGGEVREVRVAGRDGETTLPPQVLSHGRFPPLTRWQAEHPSPAVPERGFVRGEPSDERQRTHDHTWERR